MLFVCFMLVFANVLANEERPKETGHNEKVDSMVEQNAQLMKDSKTSSKYFYISVKATKKPAEWSTKNMVYKPTPKIFGFLPTTVKILPNTVNEKKKNEDTEGYMKPSEIANLIAGLFKRDVPKTPSKDWQAIMEKFKKKDERAIRESLTENNVLAEQDEYGLSEDTKWFTNRGEAERGTQDVILQNIVPEKLDEKINEMIKTEQKIVEEGDRLRWKEGKDSWKIGQEGEREMGRGFGKEMGMHEKNKIVRGGVESKGMRKQEDHRVKDEQGKVVEVVLKGVNVGGRGIKQEKEGKYVIDRVGEENERLFGVNSRIQQGNEVQILGEDNVALSGINDGIESEMIVDGVLQGERMMTGAREENRKGVRDGMNEYRQLGGKEIEGRQMEMRQGDTLGSILTGFLEKTDRMKEGERMITRNQDSNEERRDIKKSDDEYIGGRTQEEWMGENE